MITSNDFEVEIHRSIQKKQRNLPSFTTRLWQVYLLITVGSFKDVIYCLGPLVQSTREAPRLHVALDALDDEPLLAASVLLALQTAWVRVAIIVCRYGAGDDFNVFCILGEWICSSLT